MNDVIYFGTCCVPVGADSVVRFISSMGNVPSWLFVANLAVGLFNRDIYFIICSNVNFLVFASYFLIMSDVLMVKRPAGFDHVLCNASQYAFPDPKFVTTLSFALSAVAAFILDIKLHRYMTKTATTVVILLLLGYCTSTLLSHYFNAFLLVCNFIMAVCIASLFTMTYAAFLHDFNLMASSSTKNLLSRLAKCVDKECDILNDTVNNTQTGR